MGRGEVESGGVRRVIIGMLLFNIIVVVNVIYEALLEMFEELY